MGPYCIFCDQRCFVPLPLETPTHIFKAYQGRADIVATCQRGQEHEKQVLGYCYADIEAALEDEILARQAAGEAVRS